MVILILLVLVLVADVSTGDLYQAPVGHQAPPAVSFS